MLSCLDLPCRAGEVLSAVEFLDSACSDLATAYLDGVRNPLLPQDAAAAVAGLGEAGDTGGGAAVVARGRGGGEEGLEGGGVGDDRQFYMVVETHGSDADHDTQKMERFLEVGAGSLVGVSKGRVCQGKATGGKA